MRRCLGNTSQVCGCGKEGRGCKGHTYTSVCLGGKGVEPGEQVTGLFICAVWGRAHKDLCFDGTKGEHVTWCLFGLEESEGGGRSAEHGVLHGVLHCVLHEQMWLI